MPPRAARNAAAARRGDRVLLRPGWSFFEREQREYCEQRRAVERRGRGWWPSERRRRRSRRQSVRRRRSRSMPRRALRAPRPYQKQDRPAGRKTRAQRNGSDAVPAAVFSGEDDARRQTRSDGSANALAAMPLDARGLRATVPPPPAATMAHMPRRPSRGARDRGRQNRRESGPARPHRRGDACN